jgi:hypothetical protein
MNTTAAGSVLVGHQAALRELHSARPDAPVVPHDPRAAAARPRLRRTRSVTAAALHRAAHRVAPAT